MHWRMLVLIAPAVVVLGVAAPASAEDDVTSVSIIGGDLVYTTALTAENFPAVTLDGTPKVVSANIAPYVVTDARGGSAG